MANGLFLYRVFSSLSDHSQHFTLPIPTHILKCYRTFIHTATLYLNPTENLRGFVRKMRHQTNKTDKLKGAIKATWASITPQQCGRLITSMLRHRDAVILAKGPPTKYQVHKLTIFRTFQPFTRSTFLYYTCYIFFWYGFLMSMEINCNHQD